MEQSTLNTFIVDRVRLNSFYNISKTLSKPDYKISNTMKHVFVYILKPNRNRKALVLMPYFTTVWRIMFHNKNTKINKRTI